MKSLIQERKNKDIIDKRIYKILYLINIYILNLIFMNKYIFHLIFKKLSNNIFLYYFDFIFNKVYKNLYYYYFFIECKIKFLHKDNLKSFLDIILNRIKQILINKICFFIDAIDGDLAQKIIARVKILNQVGKTFRFRF